MGIISSIDPLGPVAAGGFVHLHVHSSYSLLEGAMPLKKIIAAAVADNQPAIAITDRNNLFGSLEFCEQASKAGLQPIIGCKIDVGFDPLEAEGSGLRARRPQEDENNFIVLLAATQEGYASLMELVSHAYLGHGDGVRPHASLRELERCAKGIVALTGGFQGPVNLALRRNRKDAAAERLTILQRIFGSSLYVELQRHGGHSRPTEDALIELAYDRHLPIVGTNEAYFPTGDVHEAHDALVCIADGRRVVEEDRRKLTRDHSLKSANDMIAMFSDLPEAYENTIEIAHRCASRSRTRDPILPYFAAPDGAGEEVALKAEADELRRMAVEGLERRLEANPLAEGFSRQDYDRRLDYELGIIEGMKFPGYFLIVADFIQWAKGRGIPVGPGRGSGAGSLVAWALTVTDLDPMRFSLLFERFLNPERISMPDFDIDFCQDRREEVIRYVQERYGREQVAQIITFGRLQPRAVLRDVGRVLQMPYGQVDRLCKMVPNNPTNPVTLQEAIDSEEGLRAQRDEDETVAKLLDISLKLEGLHRHASTHAAGVVIGDRPLQQLVPLYRDPRSDMPVTQLDMKWVEKAGLVKFDFLGLKTLTTLQTGVALVKQKGVDVPLDTLPLDDGPTYEMLRRGETVGVFQLESIGMRKALVGMKADRFEDIIALVALYRPGPMDNIPSYNRRKQGQETPDYIHPKIESVLKETHGIIIYQEQVMEIAQILSGYTLGEADMLRRAMGKKIKAEMDAQKGRFVEGAVANGLSKKEADDIFELLAKFANYGFNKSHAAAYALVSYQTAWLKANHPVEFLAASMTLDMGNTDKLSDFHREAKRAGIEIVAPCVNASGVRFTVADGRIFYALAAVKGVGEGAVQHIVAVREKDGPFTSLTDFFGRMDPAQINRRMMETLIVAGAFDCFGEPRERVMAGLDRLLGHASRTADDAKIGIVDMFGGSEAVDVELPPAQEWTPGERLSREFGAIGFYLSAHPLDEHRDLLKRMRVQDYREFEKAVRAGASAGRLAGTISSRQERNTRRGDKMGIINVSDPTGQYEAVIFSDGLGAHRDLLEPGRSVVLMVSADLRDDEVSIRIVSAKPLEEETGKALSNLRITVAEPAAVATLARQLAGSPDRSGRGTVSLLVLNDDREVEIELPGSHAIGNDVRAAALRVPGVVEAALS